MSHSSGYRWGRDAADPSAPNSAGIEDRHRATFAPRGHPVPEPTVSDELGVALSMIT